MRSGGRKEGEGGEYEVREGDGRREREDSVKE